MNHLRRILPNVVEIMHGVPQTLSMSHVVLYYVRFLVEHCKDISNYDKYFKLKRCKSRKIDFETRGNLILRPNLPAKIMEVLTRGVGFFGEKLWAFTYQSLGLSHLGKMAFTPEIELLEKLRIFINTNNVRGFRQYFPKNCDDTKLLTLALIQNRYKIVDLFHPCFCAKLIYTIVPIERIIDSIQCCNFQIEHPAPSTKIVYLTYKLISGNYTYKDINELKFQLSLKSEDIWCKNINYILGNKYSGTDISISKRAVYTAEEVWSNSLLVSTCLGASFSIWGIISNMSIIRTLLADPRFKMAAEFLDLFEN